LQCHLQLLSRRTYHRSRGRRGLLMMLVVMLIVMMLVMMMLVMMIMMLRRRRSLWRTLIRRMLRHDSQRGQTNHYQQQKLFHFRIIIIGFNTICVCTHTIRLQNYKKILIYAKKIVPLQQIF